MAKKSKLLEEIKEIVDMDRVENIEQLEPDATFIFELNESISMIKEERIIGYVQHSVESILMTVIFAILGNCNTFEEINVFMHYHFSWLSKYIKYENGIPSISTVKRVVSFLDPKELEELLVETVDKFNKENKSMFQIGMFKVDDIYAMDGKIMNSSSRQSSKNGSIAKTNAMSVYSVKNNSCIATEFIDKKTNEIPTAKKLLSRLNIRKKLITFDALNTQKSTIDFIASKQGYYVAPVKENHKELYDQIKDYFNDEQLLKKVEKSKNYLETTEKRNGDIDKREYGFTDDTDWLYMKDKWKGLKSIGYVKRTYKNTKGKITSDTRYYISNLPSSMSNIISTAIRKEWSIENNLHYFLDMVFKEDDSKSFVGNTQKNLNIIRKFCLAILKYNKKENKMSLNLMRHLISMDFENQIISLFSDI